MNKGFDFMKHWGLKILIMIFFFQLNALFAKDFTITFQSRAHTSLSKNNADGSKLLLPGNGEFLQGQYPLTAELISGEGEDQKVIWSEFHKNIDFSGGYFNLVLGTGDSKKTLDSELLKEDGVKLSVRVGEYQFDFPLSSFPYAIRVAQSETAIEARAEDLEPGTIFESTVTVNSGLKITMQKSAWIEKTQAEHSILLFNLLVEDGFINANGDITGYNPFTKPIENNKYLITNPEPDLGWVEKLVSLNIVLSDAATFGVSVTLPSLFSVIDSSLWNDFLWQKDHDSGDTFLMVVNKGSNRLGILTQNPRADVDVVGTVNAKVLLVNGKPIDDTFAWQKNDDDPSKVYIMDTKVGIKTRTPFFDLHVLGVINADEYLLKGIPLSHGFDWHKTDPIGGDEERFDLYFDGSGIGKVGVGTNFPVEKLDVVGGMVVEERHLPGDPVQNGTIQFENGKFSGNVGGQWYEFPGLQGMGRIAGLPYFVTSNVLGSSSRLYFNNGPPQMAVGSTATDSQFQVKQITPGLDYLLLSSPNFAVMRIDPSGNMFVGTGNISDEAKLNVDGTVSAKLILKNGVDLRKADKKGDLFSLSPDNNSIYYESGFVAFGSNKTEEREDGSTRDIVLGSNLEIGSGPKVTDIDIPTRDPVISFSLENDGDEIVYGMGIDADDKETFRVEKLLIDGVYNKIGDSRPLFVIRDGNFGMGLSNPLANLHVSGNLGMMVSGTNTGKTIIPVTDNASMMLFDPGKTSLRSGYYAKTPSEDIGEYSVSLGKDNSPRGIFSVAIGANNEVPGAYASSLGGSNNKAIGYFSLAMGASAVAKHDGTFVWNGYPFFGEPEELESTVHNQFLINTSSGVGINTVLTNTSAMTIQSTRISPTHFLKYANILAFDTFSELQEVDPRGKSYLNANGEFQDYMESFEPTNRFFEFPVMVVVPTSPIYQKLKTIYESNPDTTVQDNDFVDIISTDMIQYHNTSRSIWKNTQQAEASREIWKALESDKYIFSDGSKRSWDFDRNPVTETKYLYNPATGDGWANPSVGLKDINEKIKNRYDLDEKVVSGSFQTEIDTRIYSNTAWTDWIDNDLVPIMSKRIKESLVSEGYLKEDGNFQSFRPIEIDFFYVPFVDTQDVKAILTDVYTSYTLKTKGLGDRTGVVAKNPKNIGVGFDDPREALLAVSGNVAIGKKVDGSLDDTFITITNYATTSNINSRKFSWAVLNAKFVGSPYERLNKPHLLVSADGKMGVGTAADASTRDIRLKVASTVKAGAFRFQTGETLSPKPPVLVWQWKDSTPNIYFITGNVGIGTTSPNSLLELSSQGLIDPAITFDLDGTDYFTYGVDQNKPGIFKFQSGGVLNNNDAIFTIVDRKLGFGTGAPSQDFHVHNKEVIADRLSISTDNIVGYDLALNSAITMPGKKANGRPKGFFLNGMAMTSAGVPWIPTLNTIGEDVIYREIGIDIGIGTATPSTHLEVSGSMTVSGAMYVSELFRAKGDLTLRKLLFTGANPNNYVFFVSSDNLIMESELTGLQFEVSKVLAAGTDGSGKIVLIDENDVNKLRDGNLDWFESRDKDFPTGLTSIQRRKYPAFDYDDDTNEWVFQSDYDVYNPGLVVISGNVRLAKEKPDTVSDILDVVSFGHKDLTNLFQVDATMGYPGVFYEDTTSHNAVDFKFTFNEDWVTRGDVVDVYGVVVSLNSKNGAQLTGTGGKSIAYGLVSDVTNVDLQLSGQTTKGFKSSAIFIGDVGIGRSPNRPSTNIRV